MRVSLGGNITVTATERWLSEVRAGRAFGFGDEQNGVAGQKSHVQLFNPAGSGVNALVRLTMVARGTAGVVGLCFHDTALTTDVGAGINLLRGGAAGACHVRKATDAADLGSQIFALRLQASASFEVTAEWLAEIGPGEGIHWRDGTVADTLTVGFLWAEVTV